MRKVFVCAVAALTAIVVGAAAPPASFGAALPRDKILLTYGGKPVTCRDLVLLTWPQIQGRLRAIARYVKPPPGGDWPRVDVGLATLHGPLIFYQPPRGASVQRVLLGMCRDYIQLAVDDYLAEKVRSAFASGHKFSYHAHFHLSRLQAHNLGAARVWNAYERVYAQLIRKRWTDAQLKAALAVAFPNLPQSQLAAWAKGSRAAEQQPLPLLMDAVFPCERRGEVAKWYRKAVPDICFRFPIRAAIRAARAKYTKMVARWLGHSGFVVVENLLPKGEAGALRIIRACTGPGGGRIDKLRLAQVQVCLWLEGSPTRIDPGLGGNYSYFSDLTGLRSRAISPQKFIPLKGNPHSFLFIFQSDPKVNKALVAMNMASFLWDVGEVHVLTPPAKKVWANVHIVVPWLAQPSVKQLVHWSMASAGLPATQTLGFKLPQLVRKKYRLGNVDFSVGPGH